MNKQETKEKIKIMQAYVDGKQIQVQHLGECPWIDIQIPSWNWGMNSYRIKPEQKIRPYKNVEEFLEAQKEHGMWLFDEGTYYLPVMTNKDFVRLVFEDTVYEPTFERLLEENIIWQDGTPCGIVEEQ